MRKVALYARVSTQLQEKERTIESQKEELRRQIAKNGDVIAKEYIDDGYSGAYLDRPALEEMREALKTDLFEAVYFLAPDRIARDALHQDIIVNEILRYKKRVIINDKDYEKNPENEFALRVFGAVSQFERAKIMERTRRGRLHHWRNGQVSAHGHTIFGYRYIRKGITSPAKFVIDETEAKTVRFVFNEYVKGTGTLALSRSLEAMNFKTRYGRKNWSADAIRCILTNSTYMGIRYFNKERYEDPIPGATKKKRRKAIARDKSEWIGVKVPAIVSKTVFDKAEARLQKGREKYRRPRVPQLLNNLLRCGDCGTSYSSVRAYWKMKRPDGKEEVRHWASYDCTRKFGRHSHIPSKWKRCYNPRISCRFVDARVLRLIKDEMLIPEKLSQRVNRGDHAPDMSAGRELARIAEQIRKVEESRRKLIDGYAMGRTNTKKYTERHKAIDKEIARLEREKTNIANSSGGQNDLFNKKIIQFCANVRAEFADCTDLESKRVFLKKYIEKIIFSHGRITVLGSMSVPDMASVPFRLEGEIDDPRCRIYSRLPPQSAEYKNRVIDRGLNRPKMSVSEFKTKFENN